MIACGSTFMHNSTRVHKCVYDFSNLSYKQRIVMLIEDM